MSDRDARQQQSAEDIVDELRALYLDPHVHLKIQAKIRAGEASLADMLVARAIGGDVKCLQQITALVTQERGPRKGIRTMTDAEIELTTQHAKKIWDDE